MDRSISDISDILCSHFLIPTLSYRTHMVTKCKHKISEISRAAYRVGIFWSVSVGISWYLPENSVGTFSVVDTKKYVFTVRKSALAHKNSMTASEISFKWNKPIGAAPGRDYYLICVRD